MFQAGGRRTRGERRAQVGETCWETGWESGKLFHCVQEDREEKQIPKIRETQPKEKQITSESTLEMCVTGFSPS